MAVIKKDGFYFFDIDNKSLKFILTGESLNDEIEYVKRERIKSIALSSSYSKKIENLDFLEEFDFVEEIWLNDVEVSYEPLYKLKNLKAIIAGVSDKAQKIDFSRFEYLETLSVDWFKGFPDLSKNMQLKTMYVWKFKPFEKSFKTLSLPQSLELLHFTESNILNLEDISVSFVRKLEGHYCRNLQSLEGLGKISDSLEELTLENCPSLKQFDALYKCKNLKKIIFKNCGEISSLNWVKGMTDLSMFTFYDTKIIDGDLSPLFGINYVYFKDSKGYSHKLKDFKN